MIYTGLKYPGETPLDNQHNTLKNEGKKEKIGLSRGGYL
jgi:hypothetical protein